MKDIIKECWQRIKFAKQNNIDIHRYRDWLQLKLTKEFVDNDVETIKYVSLKCCPCCGRFLRFEEKEITCEEFIGILLD